MLAKPFRMLIYTATSLLTLALPVWAVEYSGQVTQGKQAQTAIQKLICSPDLFGADKGCHLDAVRIIDNWAFVSWSGENMGGMSILKKQGTSWKHMIGGGGAMIVQNAIEGGVPKDKAEFLVPVTRYTDPADLRNLSDWELLVMRNEVYARHGRRFQNARLKAYFATWPWYKVNPNYHDGLLTAAEKKLIDTIIKVEKERH